MGAELRLPADAEPVLAGVDLALAPTEVVALVGATGSGKSTLCHLLAHLYQPTAGVVRLGGVDLSTAEPASLRSAVALVFQEAFLFAATVRENLALGWDATDEDLLWALEAACASLRRAAAARPRPAARRAGRHALGGQRQRLALARALLRRPGLLILDDATSAVDPTVERQILDGLPRRCAPRRWSWPTASRRSLADRRPLFLDGGRIAASGTHRELLESVPAYASLARAYEQDAA